MKGPARLAAPQRNPGTSSGTSTICARISDLFGQHPHVSYVGRNTFRTAGTSTARKTTERVLESFVQNIPEWLLLWRARILNVLP